MNTPFLKAEWRNLLIANYEVEQDVLKRYVPAGTEIDLFHGAAIVSVVAFEFLNTRILGIPIPFHTNFIEVNLRFYVCRETDGIVKRGVVFIKEFVPKRAIAYIARALYNENYHYADMSHYIAEENSKRMLQYSWNDKGLVSSISCETEKEPHTLVSGSEAEFLFEHYWGYGKGRGAYTIEYEVRHPPWRFWNVGHGVIDIDFGVYAGKRIYG